MADGTAERIARPFDVTHREIWRIALPMTLAFLTTPLLGITDTAVVGRMGEAAALGGLVVGAIVFDVAFSTFNFLRAGTTGLTAQALGEGNEREIVAVFWRAMALAVAIGLALILATPLVTGLGLAAIGPEPAVADAARLYIGVRLLASPFALVNYVVLGHLLGLGRSGRGLALQVWINAGNIAFAILFGLEWGWGVRGVALGAVAGEAIGAAIGLALVARDFRRRPSPTRAEILRREGFRRMLALNGDIMIRSFCLVGTYALFTRFGAGLGSTTLAVNGILLNLMMAGSYFLDGLATASEQLVGRAVGAFWRPAFDRAVKLSIGWGVAFAAAVAAALLAGGPAFVAFLTTDEAIRQAAAPFVAWSAVATLAGALAFVMDGVFIGATWSRTMRDMMLASVAVFVAAAFALVPLYGNHGLWAALTLFLGARGIFLLAMTPKRRDREFSAPRV
ncbi:MATE family efflux transporter [Aureimonas sp. AU12]|uniref:MATE family efflux transporter n=1 Tax=Aureimonas sp. AU12 TaxID=1638161 RepID=UPI000781C15C|nr:MATE family efflux transporter [Aureimonas sp. AU12]